jgi:hypothetical protein
MQGDIQLPKFRKFKTAPKPKTSQSKTEPKVDFNISEAFSGGQSQKRDRKVLIAPHKHFKHFWQWWLGLGRNERFAFLAALFLVFGAVAIGWFYFIQPKTNPAIQISKNTIAKPTAPLTVPSPLTGVQVEPSLVKRPVTGIMIENSVFARPQSGLQDAGVVVEAIAEGGITRFLALFQEAQPQYVGPVRSLRPYYIDFAQPFQAGIVHVGGSPEALARVRNGSYRDLDQFFNSGYFYRVSYRPAPHNVYTSFAKLDQLNKSKGYTSSLFTSWPRKAEKKIAVPTAKTIDLTVSSPDYYSHYDYDPNSNTYLRSEGGAPHLDLVNANDKGGVRLQPKVVIALVMQYGIAADGQHSIYTDTGSGTAYVFQDGGVTVGTWTKADAASQVTFNDAAGLPIKLNAGQTWITFVAGGNKVAYKP